MAGIDLEDYGLPPGGYEMRHATAGSVFSARIVPAGAGCKQSQRGRVGDILDGGLSRVLCAEFAGASGLTGRRIYFLGAGVLRPQTSVARGNLVFACGAC